MDELDEMFAEKEYSDATRDGYRRLIELFLVEIADPEHLTKGSFSGWINRSTWGQAQRYKACNAIKSYLRWKYGKAHPALEFRVKRPPISPQRVFRPWQISQLMSSFDLTTAKGVRDRAIVELMVDTGLRVSEVCRLELKHVDLINRRLNVIVKGGHWAEKVFSKKTRTRLEAWMCIRGRIASPDVHTFFVGVGGLTPGFPLTRNGLKVIFKYWGEASGLGKISPHDLRRSFATIAVRNGCPERILMAQGGWSSSAMVKRYTASIEPADMEPYFPSESLD